MPRDVDLAPRSARVQQMRERRAERLNHVIDTSAALFAERGFGHVGMTELCETVELGRGQLYNLIVSKENLLKLIHDRFVDLLFDSTAHVDALDLPPAERLRELLRDLLTIVAEHRDYVRVFFSEGRALSPENRRLYRSRRLEYQTIFEDTLAAGVADGSFHIKDTRLTALAILGMVNSAHEWVRPLGMPPREIADAFCDLVLNGILS